VRRGHGTPLLSALLRRRDPIRAEGME
jgi:hypothetical protein